MNTPSVPNQPPVDFDDVLKKMLETPPDPKKKEKQTDKKKPA